MTKSTIFITGATGTLGQAVIKRLISFCPDVHVIGVSRDERKQQDSFKHARVQYVLADVRDLDQLVFAGKRSKWPISRIMHFAALKCAPFIEGNLNQALLTNVNGTANCVAFAEKRGIPITFTSTDKAVYPVNAYGLTKAMGERIVLNYKLGTVVRYGNVIGSRGSVMDMFLKSLTDRQEVDITDLQMTRFWMLASQAVDLVLSSDPGLHLPKTMFSSTVATFAEACAKVAGVREYKVNVVGKRDGERYNEYLDHDWSSDFGPFWTVDGLASAIKSTLEAR